MRGGMRGGSSKLFPKIAPPPPEWVIGAFFVAVAIYFFVLPWLRARRQLQQDGDGMAILQGARNASPSVAEAVRAEVLNAEMREARQRQFQKLAHDAHRAQTVKGRLSLLNAEARLIAQARAEGRLSAMTERPRGATNTSQTPSHPQRVDTAKQSADLAFLCDLFPDERPSAIDEAYEAHSGDRIATFNTLVARKSRPKVA